jgi:hypothetical protein
MEIVRRKSFINKKVKYYDAKECDYKDVINESNKLLNNKIWYVDKILRPRLKHITFSVDSHPKSNIISNMASTIFFEMMREIVNELFKGNTIEFKELGSIRLESLPVDTKYKGYKEDWKRAKRNGFFTMIKVSYNSKVKNTRYGLPYWSFGSLYKKKLHKLEDNGLKY